MTNSKHVGRSATYGSRAPLGSARVLNEREVKGLFGDVFVRAPSLSGSESVGRPYLQSTWFNSAVKEFATSVASLRFKMWDRDPRLKEAKEVEGHPLSELLKRPNDWMTLSQFLYAGVVHTMESGEDYWFLLNKSGSPISVGKNGEINERQIGSILPVSGRNVKIRFDHRGLPESYAYTVGNGGQEVTAAPGAVIPFLVYNPNDPFRGVGAAEVANDWIQLEHLALQHQAGLLRNSGDPGGIFTSDGPPPTIAQRKAAQEELDELSKPRNAGRKFTAHGKGLKYTPFPNSPKDLATPELLREARLAQCSVVGIPLPVIGDPQGATLANLQSFLREKWRKIENYIRGVEDVVNGHLLHRMGGHDSLVFAFDLSGVEQLRKDESELWDLAYKLSEGRGINLNEAISMVGLERTPIPEAEVRVMLGQHLTLEQLQAGENRPGLEDNEAQPDNEMDGIDEDTDGETSEADAEAEPKSTKQQKAASATSTKEARALYFKEYEASVLLHAEKEIGLAAESLVKANRKAWLKRVKAFAKSGFAALGAEGALLKTDNDTLAISSGALAVTDLQVLAPNARDWIERFTLEMEGPIARAYATAAENMALELGVLPLTIDDTVIRAALVRQLSAISVRSVETLANDITAAIVRELSSTDAVGTLQHILTIYLPRIEEAIKSSVSPAARGERVGRTEAGTAANGARLRTMQSAGIREHEWVDSGDGLVRTGPAGGHVALDGQVQEVGDVFTDINGSPIPGLTRPHAFGASAEWVVNCRCVTRPAEKKQDQ